MLKKLAIINGSNKISGNIMNFKLFSVFLIAISLIIIYIYHNVGTRPDFVLPRRINQITAMVLVSFCIAYSSIIFQTITNNRILTPGVIGFEAVYMYIQTVIVFFFGSGSYFITAIPNFFLSVVAMLLFSLLIYNFMFKKDGQNIYFLLLVGMVLSTMFSSLTSFMHMVIDPSEFWVIQGRMFASFNNINNNLLFVSFVIVVVTFIISIPFIKYLDIIALGKENAISLGINHKSVSKKLLLIIAVLVSVSTALVGPVTFLGVLVSNLTYQFISTYKHKYILPVCILITIIAVVGGHYIVSRVLNFSTTISIIINFVGGVYFMYLLLKERKHEW